MKIYFLCIVFGLTTIPRASTGGLSGKVVDSDIHQPLVGANVMVVGTGIGTSCDVEGGVLFLIFQWAATQSPRR